MKFTIIIAVIALVTIFMTLQTDAAESSSKGKLQHVVSFKFKPSATQDQIDHLVKEFAALPSKIKEIKDFEWGTNVSPENHDKGFTHCFIATFHSAQDRNAYLVHPDHKAFGKLVGPIVADVFVVDFWSKK